MFNDMTMSVPARPTRLSHPDDAEIRRIVNKYGVTSQHARELLQAHRADRRALGEAAAKLRN